MSVPLKQRLNELLILVDKLTLTGRALSISLYLYIQLKRSRGYPLITTNYFTPLLIASLCPALL
jgi:hypothetical protein